MAYYNRRKLLIETIKSIERSEYKDYADCSMTSILKQEGWL